MSGLRIGQLARVAGVSAQTVRYYERLGLIAPPQRSEAHYRLYSEADLERLLIIRRAKLFNLSLDEIKQLLELSSQGVRPCQRLDELVRGHLQRLDERIRDLTAFRDDLALRYERSRAVTGDGAVCAIIEGQHLPTA
ncbi:MAG: heavy metal-responsive transcriptional regulator [Bacillota bacterium]